MHFPIARPEIEEVVHRLFITTASSWVSFWSRSNTILHWGDQCIYLFSEGDGIWMTWKSSPWEGAGLCEINSYPKEVESMLGLKLLGLSLSTAVYSECK